MDPAKVVRYRARTTVERSNSELKSCFLPQTLYSRGCCAVFDLNLSVLLLTLKRMAMVLEKRACTAWWKIAEHKQLTPPWEKGGSALHPEPSGRASWSSLGHSFPCILTAWKHHGLLSWINMQEWLHGYSQIFRFAITSLLYECNQIYFLTGYIVKAPYVSMWYV